MLIARALKTLTMSRTDLKRKQSTKARTSLFAFCCLIPVNVVLVVFCVTATEARGQDDTNPRAEVHPFGTPEVLQEKLLRVRERETFAERLQTSGPGDQDFESLLRFFAEPQDGFLYLAPDKPVSSFRGTLIHHLKSAPVQIQRAWDQMTSVVSEAELRDALSKADPREFERVAAKYPVSRVSLQCRLLAATTWLLTDQPAAAARQLDILRLEFGGSNLESEAGNRQRAFQAQLTHRLSRLPASSPSVTTVSAHPQSIEVSAAWPVPNWTWTENLWLRSGVPRVMTDQLLSAYQPETTRGTSEFHNWPVIVWGDECILRTPLRLVAIDASTGKERWSLPTDTFKPPARIPSSPVLMNEEFPKFVDQPLRLSGTHTFGILTSDDEYLWLLDHFDVFDGKGHSAFDEGFGNPVRNPFRMGGDRVEDTSGQPATRLVALRRTSGKLPEVAWTVGTASAYSYKVVQKISEHPLAGEASGIPKDTGSLPRAKQDLEGTNKTASPKDTLTGHRFLSAPVVHGEQLFILSAVAEQCVLNCLQRRTGKIEWQQPIAFFDRLDAQRLDAWNPADGCSVCFVSHESVICSLADGLMAAVRANDGQLLWAMATRDTTDANNENDLHMMLEEDRIDSPAIFTPVTNGRVIVCSSPVSTTVKAVDIETGKILWQVDRRAFGPGDVGNSPDYYVAALLDQQVILAGKRHCRSLDLSNGTQHWVTEIPNASGRAICGGQYCLIPQSSGPLIFIRLSDGKMVSTDHLQLTEMREFPYGALAGFGNRVLVSTPVSVTSYDTVNSLIKPDVIQQLTEHRPVSDDVVLKQAQLLSLTGRRTDAVELLKLATREAQANSQNHDDRITRFLAEITLHTWGDELFGGGNSGGFSPHNEEDLQLLAELPLTPEQQLRVAVLTLLKRPSVEDKAETIRELTEFREWKSPVSVTETWSVRPDILLNAPARLNELTQVQFDAATIPQLRALAADIVVFPESEGALRWYRPLLQRLIQSGEVAAAELIAAACLNVARAGSSEASARRDELDRLRSMEVVPGFDPEKIYEKFHPADRPSAAISSEGLQSSDTIEATSTPLMHQAWWDMSTVERGATIGWTPAWMKHRAMLIDGIEGVEFITLDSRDGQFRDRLVPPSALGRDTLGFRQTSEGIATPGLVPLTGAEDIMMVSCVVPGRSSIIWSRRYRTNEPEDVSVEFGPLTASVFVWHFNGILHCTNPVTGQDLWTRNLPLSPEVEYQPGIKRIFGDDSVIVVMGSDLESYRRFRTHDGQELPPGRLQFGHATETKTFGRFIVYSDFESRIRVFDGAAAEDILADEEPITAGSNSLDQIFQLLPEDRVLTVSSNHQIVMIDARAGKIQFSTTVRELIDNGSGIVFGVMAFERNGRLFVGLEDNRIRGLGGLIGNNRTREPQLADGLLLSLEPQTGALQWSQRLSNSVFPAVAGSPTDLMVAWGLRTQTDDNGDELDGEFLDVQLIDSNTGEIKAKESMISSSRPFFCHHVAADSVIELITRDGTIRFSVKATEKESPKPESP